MPPKKRSTNDSDLPKGSDEPASVTAKRQRVSLACDGCRAAREKCDGGRPHCEPCLSQKRPCSYTPAFKKRGVQTGYLRAIELSLAWLLEKAPDGEETLYELLTQNDGVEGVNILINKDKSSNRLHKRWANSRIHKQIERLLSNNRTQTTETRPGDSDTDGDTAEPSPDLLRQGQTAYNLNNSGEIGTSARLGPEPKLSLRLPSNYQHLLEVYFTYTHCWLPILDQQKVSATATWYNSHGSSPVYTTNGDKMFSHSAELWAAMAVAAFQDAQLSSSTSDPSSSPARIFAIARSFISHEEGAFDLAIVRAILLHVIILIGRGSELAASLLVGKAVKLLLHLKSTEALNHNDLPNPNLAPPVVACFFLDALTSLCLGQSPSSQLLDHLETVSDAPFAAELSVSAVPWSPVPGFGQLSLNSESPGYSSKTQPHLVLDQLGRFARILSANITFGGESLKNSTAIEDLVACLRAGFGFCNSVVAGGSTPMLPSAYLVKAMFLAFTIELAPRHQSSLHSIFLDIIESGMSNFGACGTPPIVVASLLLVQRHSNANGMRRSETTRLNLALNTLRTVWLQDPGTDNLSETLPKPHLQSRSIGLESFNQDGSTTRQLGIQEESASQMITPGYELFPPDMGPPPGSQPQNFNELASTSTVFARNPGMPSQPTRADSRQPVNSLRATDHLEHSIDYDAILEELGSIDYTDNIDMDPQFMMNLGFAPGCDLGEMFQGDFGV